MMIKANFLQPEIFEYKFKRKPKDWTLEQIHDLWVKACDRYQIQRENVSKCTKEIVDTIPKNDKGNHVVYFTHDGIVRSYTFHYHSEYKSYGVSTDTVKFSDDKAIGRSEKLDFLLSNDRSFQLGERYRELDKLCSNKHWVVKEVMWRIAEDRLREKFKKEDVIPPSVFIFKLSNRKYYVTCNDRYSVWKKFELKEECSESIVEL